MSATALAGVLAGGIVLGALYALMAAGLAVVWTTLGIFNFAHGTFIALGAYIAWQAGSSDALGLGYGAGLAITVPAMFAIGVVSYFLLIKPFERSRDIVVTTVITTLAGATILENLITLIWGARNKQIEGTLSGEIDLLGARFSANEAMTIVVSLVGLLLLGLFLRRAPLGRAMRAVAQNREAAQLMGINVTLLYALAFGLSVAMAGLAGVFIGSIRFMSPTMGADPLMKALIVVIFAGVARFTGPIYAAFIVGILESFTVYYVGLYWSPTVLFAVMIVVLIIKPEGLFGQYRRTVS